MLRRRLTITLALAALLATASAHAQGYSREASRILNAARAASGGKGWTALHGWHETGVNSGARYEAWIDPIRYGMRVETPEAGGTRVHGFNGVADWQISPDGRVSGVNDHASLARARNDAFFNGWLFFFPSRFDARGAYVGVRSAGGRSYDVLKIQPWGGTPRELWFDRSTHRLGRMVDRTGPRATAVLVSDYRKVGPVTVAFRYEPDPGGAGRRQIDSLTFAAADRDLFSLPRTPPPPPKIEAPPPPPAPPTEAPKKKKPWWRR